MIFKLFSAILRVWVGGTWGCGPSHLLGRERVCSCALWAFGKPQPFHLVFFFSVTGAGCMLLFVITSLAAGDPCCCYCRSISAPTWRRCHPSLLPIPTELPPTPHQSTHMEDGEPQPNCWSSLQAQDSTFSCLYQPCPQDQPLPMAQLPLPTLCTMVPSWGLCSRPSSALWHGRAGGRAEPGTIVVPPLSCASTA